MYDLIAHHSTTQEMIYHVPLDNSRHIAYQCYVPDLHEKDLIVAGCNYEITQIKSYFMCTAHHLIITKNKDDIHGVGIAPATGIDIPGCKAYHVNPSVVGTIVVPEEGFRWVSLIVYSGSVRSHRGDYCLLEQGYGKLYVLHYKEQVSFAD